MVQSPKGLLQGLEDFGIKRTCEDHPKKKALLQSAVILRRIPKDLRRLAFTQTLMRKPSANAGMKKPEKE